MFEHSWSGVNIACGFLKSQIESWIFRVLKGSLKRNFLRKVYKGLNFDFNKLIYKRWNGLCNVERYTSLIK